MSIKHDPFVYCQGCRKEHTMDKVESIEVIPYNTSSAGTPMIGNTQIYWCNKMEDVYISTLYNSQRLDNKKEVKNYGS